jgi:uncharacterized protein
VTVCLDSNCAIYLVEKNPLLGPRVVARLAAYRASGHKIAVTDLALTECLSGPLLKGDAATVADYQSFFKDPDILVLALTPAVCERAAYLRAASNFKISLPDCLHLAAAIVHGCDVFLTNDVQLLGVGGIAVEAL